LTSHANVSAAFKRSSHWDPGPNFPVTVYLRVVKAELPASERKKPVIVNMPLEETIAMLKKTPAYKRGWRRMVELVQRYESMRKK
jgi:hypothetical protein